MAKIRCVVERITYQNPENGYTVLKTRVKGQEDLVAVVGNLFDVVVGSILSIEGEWKVDRKYGKQFIANSWEETMPATVYGIEKYLGSGLIKGVGPKFAKRIVKKFGEQTIEIIEQEPDKLLQVEGIGQKRIQLIQASWEQQKEVKNIMLFLQGHGVSTTYAAKIYKQYGNDSISIVKKNPYRLADDIWGIGFKTADTIAEKMGFEKESFVRLRSGIMYTLGKLAEDGHVFALQQQLIDKAYELLQAGQEYIIMTLDQMIKDEDIKKENDAIYLLPFYYAETGVSNKLKKLLQAPAHDFMPKQINVEQIEKSLGMQYDSIQKSAIQQAAQSKVMILTGGPGTGKTTTTKGIIAAYQLYGLHILLAAPTGRAAKRMTEATGMEAKTLHRLLECKPPNGYQKNDKNPLKGDVLIVDESSMIDILMMNALLKAIPDSMRLVMVGDIDQLPSVGAGNVLRDLIASAVVPVTKLTTIFRQAQSSRIIMNAHRINEGKLPDISNGKTTDFFFMQREEAEETVEEIVKLVKTKLPNYYHVNSKDIQVLTPMQRGVVGAANLNLELQKAINPSGTALIRSGVTFREQDKVMQIKNNYDKDVFNGDIGNIVRVDSVDRTLCVDYDGHEVEYDITELDEIIHAYATTIHKSQGSEYPVVVIPILMNHYIMLQRNLIYTGITRAKKICVMVGTKKALAYAVHNLTVSKRNTLLKERLNGTIASEQYSVSKDMGETSSQERIQTYQQLFSKLAKSKFRSRFHLSDKDKEYIKQKGMDVIGEHGMEFITQRLAPAMIENDGKQTPMKGHPIFVAQHATGCCCRGCLYKWHHIEQGRELTEEEKKYIFNVLMEWIKCEIDN